MKSLAVALTLALAAPAALAQTENASFAEDGESQAQIVERERAEAAGDEIRALVFSPEFILANRRAISLSDRQRDRMVVDLQGLQRQLIAQQDAMQDARAALILALRSEPANETRVLSALDEVLNIEREVKRLQLQALVRLRDALTPNQRAQLYELRNGR